MTDGVAESEGRRSVRVRGAYATLTVLFLIGLINYIDRVTFNVLQVPIKTEFGLSDTQLGILSGVAFSLPYVLLSIPMGWLADRINRKWMLIAALAVWGSMTAALGTANGFIAMMVFRMGVGIGEACCLPIVHSITSDYFPRAQRGRAMAVVSSSLPVGTLIGLSAAGVIAHAFGWRYAFIALGAISVALIPVIVIFLKEPQRRDEAHKDAVPAKPLSFTASLQFLWRIRSLRLALCAAGLQAITTITILHWSAPFYGRTHGLNLSQVGILVGVVLGISGAAGTFLSGYLTDKLGARDAGWMLRIPAWGCMLILPAALLQFGAPGLILSVAGGILTALLNAVYIPALYASSQSLVPANMRAMTSAVVITTLSVVGNVIGSVLVGYISDVMHRYFGDAGAGLRAAICIAILASLAASILFFRAARLFPQDLLRAQSVGGDR